MKNLSILMVLLGLQMTASVAQNSAPSPAQPAPKVEGPCAKLSFPRGAWKHISGKDQKQWSHEKLEAAQQYAESLHDSSFQVVHCGRVVYKWGDVSEKLTTFSVRKSFISALYGIYSAEGQIDIDETLEEAGIDDTPSPLTKEERQARIVDLLRARSGIYHAAGFETDFQRKSRPARGSHSPGTFWFYNNWDFNALGTIFEKKTGMKIGDAFNERIAKPIGMQDFKPGDVFYVGNEETSMHPAYMFRMTARDMARFGLLYLNHGRWKSLQVIPEAWVEKSTHANEMVHVGRMNVGGYEYLWWVEYGGVHLSEGTLPGMYSAQGAGGHIILNIPSLNLVIVNQFDNEPKSHDAESVLLAAQNKHAMFDEQVAHLVKLVLDARTIG